MLQSMRSAISSWFVKILLAALVLSFVTFYGWRSGGELGQGTVASVNGEDISAKDFQLRFQSMLSFYQNMGMANKDLSPQMIEALQNNILDAMINQYLEVPAAKKMGLVASEKAIKQSIEKQFTAKGGTFDFDLYKKILERRLGKHPTVFEKEEGDALLAKHFQDIIQRTSLTSSKELKLMYAARNNKVSLSFVWLDPSIISNKMKNVTHVSETQLQEYFQKNTAKYRIPEKRQLEVAWYQLTDFVSPTHEELEEIQQEHFPKEQEKVQTEERIRAAHILLKIAENHENEKIQQQRIQTIYTKIKNGADFAQTARLESEDFSRYDGGDLGYFGHDVMTKEFEKTAFALKKNEVSKPIKSSYGFHIIKLLDRIPAGKPTTERLKPELMVHWRKKVIQDNKRREELQKKVETLLTNMKNTIQDKHLSQMTQDEKLNYLKTDWIVSGEKIVSLPDDRDSSLLGNNAQTLGLNNIGNPIQSLDSERVYLVQVVGLQGSRDPNLAEVKSVVEKDLLRDEQAKLFDDFAILLLKKWQTQPAHSIKTLASTLGLKSKTTGLFTQDETGKISNLGVSSEVMQAAFDEAHPMTWYAKPVMIDHEIYIVAVEKTTPPDWKLFESEKKQLRELADEEVARERMKTWTSALRAKAKIQKNLGHSS